MIKEKNGIIKDQEYFFNINARIKKKSKAKGFFYSYVNKEHIEGFRWISDQKKILEYGCSTGTSLDLLSDYFNLKKHKITGVDIAGEAIKVAKKKYPYFNFYKISDNKIPQISKGSLDAVFMFHVLHHAENHSDIFKTIHSKLKKNGKFVINDLTSNNIFVNFGRFIFPMLAFALKNKFKDDLVVDGKIPEKNKLNIKKIKQQLIRSGFKIEEIIYGHLFLFVCGWFEDLTGLRASKIKLLLPFFKLLLKIEEHLLRYDFFKNNAHLLFIKCVKK